MDQVMIRFRLYDYDGEALVVTRKECSFTDDDTDDLITYGVYAPVGDGGTNEGRYTGSIYHYDLDCDVGGNLVVESITGPHGEFIGPDAVEMYEDAIAVDWRAFNRIAGNLQRWPEIYQAALVAWLKAGKPLY